ncbi:hypothetical protein SCHPADRAFT_939578 [Schizopora paradoxa]|uniref:Hydrophobin n=1 Tax=Schizopora paradoxa TaxID=27342 RepID=A0A0H2RQY8_9AGAM|nr:hypothetical protein SCHPADRAFT_939578 [Schizopora paradoxa]
MQFLNLVISLALASTMVVATPAPAPELPVCLEANEPCIGLLSVLCCSGTCNAGSGLLGSLLGTCA